MTKLSLRQAAAIAEAITQEHKATDIETDHEFSEHMDPRYQLDVAGAALTDTVTERYHSLTAVYELRRLLGKANAEHGISDILARLAFIQTVTATLAPVVKAELAPSVETVTGNLDRIRQSGNSYYSRYSASVKTQALHELCEDQIAKLRQEKIKLKDRMLHLNITNTVEPSQETIDYLTKHKYI